jgi:hypothetical protein
MQTSTVENHELDLPAPNHVLPMPEMKEREWKERISQSRSAAAKTTGCQNHRERQPTEHQGIGNHANPEIATTGFQEDEINRFLKRQSMFIVLSPQPFEQVRLLSD